MDMSSEKKHDRAGNGEDHIAHHLNGTLSGLWGFGFEGEYSMMI